MIGGVEVGVGGGCTQRKLECKGLIYQESLSHVNKGEKSGRWGGYKGWREGEEGEGRGGVHSLTIWIYCFRIGGEGWRAGGGERREDRKGGGHALGESGQPQGWDSVRPPTSESHFKSWIWASTLN